MNKQEFEQKLTELCPWVNQETFDLFEKYKQFIQNENQKHNLTRLADEDKIYQSYFLESLIPYLNISLLNENSEMSLLDIGSGSGIPGVVLKIVFRNLKVCLLDSNKKKTDFLEQLIKELGLQEITVIYSRAEEYVQTNYESFDIVTSRAVSSLYKILELSTGYAKVDGIIIQPKSLKADEELKEATGTIKTLDLKMLEKIEYNFYDHQHTVFVFSKLKPTNRKYPRTWQQILKKPL